MYYLNYQCLVYHLCQLNNISTSLLKRQLCANRNGIYSNALLKLTIKLSTLLCSSHDSGQRCAEAKVLALKLKLSAFRWQMRHKIQVESWKTISFISLSSKINIIILRTETAGEFACKSAFAV